MGKPDTKRSSASEIVVALSRSDPAPTPDLERARALLQASPVDGAALAPLPVDVQEAAVEVLASHRNTEALVALETATPHKSVRKAAGRALHVLRTKGVTVPTAPPAGEPFRFRLDEGSLPKSYATIHDPEGDRMVWYSTAQRGVGAIAFQAVVQERDGLTLFQTFHQITPKLRKHIFDELAKGNLNLFEVDNAYARWLIEEGVQRTERAGGTVPKEYFEAKMLLGPAPDFSSVEHPALGVLGDWPSNAARDSALRASADLFLVAELAAWKPTGDALQRLSVKIDEVKQSQIVLNERQRAEQVRASFARAAREYFAGEERHVWSRRLLDAAHFLWQTGKPVEARAARAVADQLADDASDPGDNPFAVALFERFYKMSSEGGENAAPAESGESSIIVPGV